MATLALPDDARTVVWRLIRDQLQADPILHEQVATWLVWEGTDDDTKPLADVSPPALRLTPVIGPQSWYDAQAEKGYLLIDLEVYLSGTDVEDVLNMQGVIESALYPPDPSEQNAFQAALVAAGAITGLIEFHEPISEKLKLLIGSTGFTLLGALRIEVQRSLIA